MLGAIGALVLAAFVTLLVVESDDGGPKRVVAGTSTTSSSSTSTSSSSTSTSTSVPSTTTIPATSTTGAAPTTAPTQTVVTGQGAVLTPSGSDTRVIPPGGNCNALADAGWTSTCGTATAKAGTVAWLIETKPVSGGGTARRALLFRHGNGQEWILRLQAADDAGTQFNAIRTRVEDVSGDGAADVAFGFTRTGASAVLAVDLVEGPGTVVVHRELPKGAARVSSGQLDTWRRVDASHYSHEVIQFRNGAWRIVDSSQVAPGDVPPSQL